MITKEYLQSVRDLDRQIGADMIEICRLRAMADKVTSILTTEVRVAGYHEQKESPVEEAVLRLEEMREKTAGNIHKYVKMQDEVKSNVMKIKKAEERQVLLLRYISGLKWEDISEEMHYSLQHIHRLHNKALKTLAKLHEKQLNKKAHLLWENRCASSVLFYFVNCPSLITMLPAFVVAKRI